MDPAAFYETLAPWFRLIHRDWEASVERQGGELDAVLREFAPGARTVLDCACGIGTQALGLAARGYRVAAADISAGAVERARAEADRRGLPIEFAVRDMRADPGARFDVVLAADNAIPHLLTDEEIADAFRTFRRAADTCLISVRDYAAAEAVPLQLQPHAVHRVDGRLVSIFQVREFDGSRYTVHMHVIDGDRLVVARTRYYAVSIARLMELLGEAGFDDVRRLDGRFYQPLILAR